MKILLLEDNISLAEIIKEMLEEKGHKVDWFDDGEAALFESANGYEFCTGYSCSYHGWDSASQRDTPA